MTDLLFETPDNPVPQNAAAGFVTARDGKRIRYAHFAATGRPLRGTVIVLSGRNECIEKYFETIGNLSDRGFGAIAMDWRGQGASDRLIRDGARGYVRDFGDYVSDLAQLMEEIVLPDCRGPYYVLAHSTGSLIALLAAPVLRNRVHRMVVVAPLLALEGLPFSMQTLNRLSAAMSMIGLGRMYMPGSGPPPKRAPFEANKLTSDPVRYARNRELVRLHPELFLGGPTAGWMHAACKAVERVRDPEFLTNFRIPVLLVACGSDEVVSTPEIEDFNRHMRAASLVTVDGARHELLQEKDVFREQFFAAFDAFIPGSDEPLA